MLSPSSLRLIGTASSRSLLASRALPSVTALAFPRHVSTTPTPPSTPVTPAPAAPVAPAKQYSPLTIKIVQGLAKLMGGNSQASTAIRVTGILYDRCAEIVETEEAFIAEGESCCTSSIEGNPLW